MSVIRSRRNHKISRERLAYFERWFARAKYAIREEAIRRVGYVPLDQTVVVRPIGHGKAAPLAVLQQKCDLLPCLKVEVPVGGQVRIRAVNGFMARVAE